VVRCGGDWNGVGKGWGGGVEGEYTEVIMPIKIGHSSS
jgi:uncharacterized protein YndB with AHSA1/START domain